MRSVSRTVNVFSRQKGHKKRYLISLADKTVQKHCHPIWQGPTQKNKKIQSHLKSQLTEVQILKKPSFASESACTFHSLGMKAKV